MSREFRDYTVDVAKMLINDVGGQTTTVGKKFGPIRASSPDKAAEFALDNIDKKHFGPGEYRVSVKMENGFVSTSTVVLYPESKVRV